MVSGTAFSLESEVFSVLLDPLQALLPGVGQLGKVDDDRLLPELNFQLAVVVGRGDDEVLLCHDHPPIV